MENYKVIKKELRNALDNPSISSGYQKAKSVMKELEVLLQKNIAIDEALLEKNKELTFVSINEKIKEAIFEAELEILFKTRSSKEWKPISIYLDDKRTTPNGYVRTFWPSQVEVLLFEFYGDIEEVSLDHDLGNDDIGTGYDVVCHIEEKVYFNRDYKTPIIKAHTDNASAKEKMLRGIKQIESF